MCAYIFVRMKRYAKVNGMKLLMPISLTRIDDLSAKMTFNFTVNEADLAMVLDAIQAMIRHAQQAIDEGSDPDNFGATN